MEEKSNSRGTIRRNERYYVVQVIRAKDNKVLIVWDRK